MWFPGADTGRHRERFRTSEILTIAGKRCPLPCHNKEFNIQLEKLIGEGSASSISLQIVLGTFEVLHHEEYYRCDSSCILGELGGNLGLFLGGSFLLGLDLVSGLVNKFITKIFKLN